MDCSLVARVDTGAEGIDGARWHIADAALWLDPGPPAEQAEQLLRSVARGTASFSWFKVGAVGSRPESGAGVGAAAVSPDEGGNSAARANLSV